MKADKFFDFSSFVDMYERPGSMNVCTVPRVRVKREWKNSRNFCNTNLITIRIKRKGFTYLLKATLGNLLISWYYVSEFFRKKNAVYKNF